jgi:AAA15 family ATPase/GTPase
MLLGFRLKNFQSFKDDIEISLEQNKNVPEDGRSYLDLASESRVSKALAVLGPNASGKTTLIKSLAFINWFVKESFKAQIDSPIPLSQFFTCTSQPSEFEVRFTLNGKEWKYCLSVDGKRVYSESLYCKETRAFSYIFQRNWNPDSGSYDVKQKKFGMSQKEAEKVRENASLISTAVQYAVPIAEELYRTGFWTNVYVLGRHAMDDFQLIAASNFYGDNEPVRQEMSRLLSSWDLGLQDIRVQKQLVTNDNGETSEIIRSEAIHKVDGVEHSLPLALESSGTRGAYLLLSRIIPALQSGGLVVIDELEADLHPMMLTPILDLFFSTESNPNNAQIIFTSHSIEVMHLLHKSQVVLVEKNENCESDAWRLDSVKGLRADDNLYAKYMAGAYGAVPVL